MNDDVLGYQGAGTRVSRWALAVFCLSIVTAVGFFLVLPALVSLLLALVVKKVIQNRTDIAGQRFASAAVTISGCSLVLGMITIILLPAIGHERRRCVDDTCEANLRGIVQSMNVYGASEGDTYPVVPFAPYTRLSNEARGSLHPIRGEITNVYYSAPFPQAGSVQACMWLLAMRGDVSTKQFICPSDPFKTSAANTSDTAGQMFDNFQRGSQLSYSFAYPWMADGKVGPWWKATADESVPIAADMTPMQGTGTPARNVVPAAAPADPRTWNSGNHQGQGQVVAFGDAHAEFVRRPDVGHDNDNIYSMAGSPSKGPAQFGGIPAGAAAPQLMADKPPYDIVMLPVRNETTGGY